jgi:hypothetical protein
MAESALPPAVDADDWDAAHEVLLAVARDPAVIRRLATALTDAASRAIALYSHRRMEWDHKVMDCGHERRHYVVSEGKTAAQFVEDAAANGECVVCRCVNAAVEAEREQAAYEESISS